MLVLERTIGESFVLTVPPSAETQTIVVTVVNLKGKRAFVGFEAPPEVRILRSELVEQEAAGE